MATSISELNGVIFNRWDTSLYNVCIAGLDVCILRRWGLSGIRDPRGLSTLPRMEDTIANV